MIPDELDFLIGEFGSDIDSLFSKFQSGELGLDEWETAFASMMEEYQFAAMMTGVGNPLVNDPLMMLAGKQTDAQLDYLKNFGKVIRSGIENNTPQWPMWGARAKMYADAITPTFWQGRVASVMLPQGVVEAGVLPPLVPDENGNIDVGQPGPPDPNRPHLPTDQPMGFYLPLPAYPGDGSSICWSHDRCSWDIVTIDKNKGDFDCFWRLAPVEHCFPVGTLIDTNDGKKAIEDIKLGDLVCTTKGLRKVIKLFKNKFNGHLIRVTSGNFSVECTPNHPFLTKRGWVRADLLRDDDQVMIFEDGFHITERNISFPYSNNSVTATGKIGILRSISTLLGKLSFGKRIKAWMTMPVFSVSLNNNISDFNVNDELRLNKEGRFINNTKRVEDVAELKFKPTWLISLIFLVTNQHLFVNFCKFSVYGQTLTFSSVSP